MKRVLWPVELVLSESVRFRKYLFFFGLLLLFFSENTFSAEPEPHKNICRFEGIKEGLTVGDVFQMHCKWSIFTILSPPLRVEIPPSEVDPKLSRLLQKTVNRSPLPFLF